MFTKGIIRTKRNKLYPNIHIKKEGGQKVFFEGKLQQKVYIYIVYIQKESKKSKIRGLSFGNPTIVLW